METIIKTPQEGGRALQRGFTLIEVLIALGLGVGILLALTMLFSSNSGNQAELERTIRQLESARFALDTLAEDVMHAGYYSDFNPDSLLVAYQMPDPCALPTNLQGWNTAVSPVQVPVPIQGIAAATAIACLNNRRPNTEAIVVRRAETGPTIPIASRAPGNLYIQISRCSADGPRVLALDGSSSLASFSLRRPDCPANPASINDAIRRLAQRTYYIANCNDCTNNDGIPTLKRVEMIPDAAGNPVLRITSIAEGVEDLQVEYGFDNPSVAPPLPADGQPDTFATMGSGAGAAPNLWENVVTARLHLLTRGTQKTPGYVDSRTYRLGPDVVFDASLLVPTDADGGFKRTLMTSTVRLYNVGMRRE